MAVRMKDIARDLNVSVDTVSKVLRNNADISEATRERVLKRMQELNYRPNLAARALVTGRTDMIGLIVPGLVQPFFANVAKGLSKVLSANGYSLLIASSEEDASLELREIDSLIARRVDVLVLASSLWTVECFGKISAHKIPYVLLDRKFAGLEANFVGVDDVQVGRLATQHLVEQGCRKIAHIRGTETSSAAGRQEGYRKVLEEHDLQRPPKHVVMAQSVDNAGDESGYEAMQKLLKLDERPDAVFCYNDSTALGAMTAIHDAGLRVPEDVALVGCGNVPYSRLLGVPLTSVDQQSLAIGEQAAKLALKLRKAKKAIRPKEILLEPTLVPRASSIRRLSS